MRKKFLLISSLALVMSLTACGGTATQDTQTASSTEASEEVTEAVTEAVSEEEFHQEVEEVVVDTASISDAKDYFTLNELPITKPGDFSITVDNDKKLDGTLAIKPSNTEDGKTIVGTITVPLTEEMKKADVDVTQWINFGFIDQFTGACVVVNGEDNVYAELIPEGKTTSVTITSERVVEDDTYTFKLSAEVPKDYEYATFFIVGSDKELNDKVSYNNFVNDIEKLYPSGIEEVLSKYTITYYQE